eukprot:gnl/MRDRNA2_/MRDRNA2_65609_c0_seq1.p1 gnl/MRDRNA2_/MRDRNA2_65609_c0~~gnl/MRDRNA2_/MRDRNA2_65609_c0_seq1.p1  ORF type:complete len:107 (-),score=6.81 gnl/MRDRNA2_/MRDRNA2_65609_c0_seq1:387-707(-)
MQTVAKRAGYQKYINCPQLSRCTCRLLQNMLTNSVTPGQPRANATETDKRCTQSYPDISFLGSTLQNVEILSTILVDLGDSLHFSLDFIHFHFPLRKFAQGNYIGI